MHNADGVGFFVRRYMDSKCRWRESSTKTHIIINGKPICNSNIHPDAEYQWCSSVIYIPYVKCGTCSLIHATRKV